MPKNINLIRAQQIRASKLQCCEKLGISSDTCPNPWARPSIQSTRAHWQPRSTNGLHSTPNILRRHDCNSGENWERYKYCMEFISDFLCFASISECIYFEFSEVCSQEIIKVVSWKFSVSKLFPYLDQFQRFYDQICSLTAIEACSAGVSSAEHVSLCEAVKLIQIDMCSILNNWTKLLYSAADVVIGRVGSQQKITAVGQSWTTVTYWSDSSKLMYKARDFL